MTFLVCYPNVHYPEKTKQRKTSSMRTKEGVVVHSQQ